MDLSNFWNFNPSLPVYNLQANHFEQRGKYRRSTNNSHKKFISVARKLLFKICSGKQRIFFEKQFETYKNSRTFYFIILAHVKLRMNKEESKRFTTAFVSALNRKIQNYNNQIRNTTNSNFIHFRFQEISDIEYAIKAMQLYFDQKIEQAIETVYRKDRLTLFKRQQYDIAVKTISELEKRLKTYQPGPLFPYIEQDERDHQYISRKLPIQFLPQLPDPCLSINNNQSKRKKQSDQEWQAEEEDSVCPRRKMKFHKRKTQEKLQKKSDEMQKKIALQPLLQLENSYPFFPDFYKIFFNYEFTSDYPSLQGNDLIKKPHLANLVESQVKKQVSLSLSNPILLNNAYIDNGISMSFKNHNVFQDQKPNIKETERQNFF